MDHENPWVAGADLKFRPSRYEFFVTVAKNAPRRFQRYQVRLLAVAMDAAPRLDHVHNLSKAGAALSSIAAPSVGAHYTFLLVIPDTKTRSLVVKLPAKVVWSGTTKFGVRFERRDSQLDTYLDQISSAA
jgi:hypothetical protein